MDTNILREKKMFSAKYTLIIYFSAIFLATTADLPADVKRCKITSTGETLNACIKEAANVMLPKLEKGIPELGISSAQPLILNNFTVGQGSGIVHVVQNYFNAVVHDIIQARVQKVSDASITKQEVKVQLELFARHYILAGTYDLNGRLLLLPVFGKGECEIELNEIKIPIAIVCDITEKNGESFLTIKEFKLQLYPKSIRYNFKNLFNGNKILGDNINAVLNDNAMDVFNDVKKGYEDVIGKACKRVCDQIVGEVPLKNLFIL